MKIFTSLARKQKKIAAGIMSGTSADSVDVVLAEIRGSGISTTFKEIGFSSFPYPKGYREFLLHHSLPGNGSVDILSTLNIYIAEFFADAVISAARKANIPLTKIDFIGSHGQTVHHIPQGKNFFGKTIRSTLQLGDISTIAKRTGILTVGNFRTADMAVGGQGAPFVPYFDFVALRSTTKNRAVLNIGGIANITLLPKNCTLENVFAFDTGPGNMLLDALTKKFYKKEFDANGEIAAKGKIIPSILSTMLKHPYFAKRPPKSTGREEFGMMFLQPLLKNLRSTKNEDIVATVAEFTALTIFEQFNRFLRPKLKGKNLDELIVSGGGAKNIFLLSLLKKYFSPANVLTSSECGISEQSKEALCFALLANETIHENYSNVPSVTGAKRAVILGTISLP